MLKNTKVLFAVLMIPNSFIILLLKIALTHWNLEINNLSMNMASIWRTTISMAR